MSCQIFHTSGKLWRDGAEVVRQTHELDVMKVIYYPPNAGIRFFRNNCSSNHIHVVSFEAAALGF